jgi:flagellin-like protein
VDRGISPVVGVVLMTVCVVALAGVVGAMALGYDPVRPASAVVVTGTVDAATNELVFTLERGGPLDVRELSITIEVDGEPLEKQPPVPFVGAPGFSTPSGPFNASADPTWERGETATLRIATTTNGPLPESDSRVTVRLYERDLPVATVETVTR